MDLDNFIIGKTKERRGDERFGKKKQQLLSKHRVQLMAKIAKKTAPTSCCKTTKNQQGAGSVEALRVPKRK